MQHSKVIEGMGELQLYAEFNYWVLTESEDSQSYSEYEDAKADYDKVVDLQTLTDVFKWKDNPFGV